MQWKRVFHLACLAAVIVLFVGADTNQTFETLGHKMMCQCGCNQVLLECNHVGCTVSEQMRNELTAALTMGQLPGESQNSRQNNRAVAAAGTTTTGGPQNPSGPTAGGTSGGATVVKASRSDDEIIQGFVNKYGPIVLAAPTQTGFNRVAWIMPYAALILGFGLVAVIVKKWKARQQSIAVGVAASVGTEQMDEFRRRARQETEI